MKMSEPATRYTNQKRRNLKEGGKRLKYTETFVGRSKRRFPSTGSSKTNGDDE